MCWANTRLRPKTPQDSGCGRAQFLYGGGENLGFGLAELHGSKMNVAVRQTCIDE